MQEKKTHYFKRSGKYATRACLKIVKNEVENNGYRYIVLSSTTGRTGLLFSDAFRGRDVTLVVVTPPTDSKKPERSMMPENVRKKIVRNGATVFSHLMHTDSTTPFTVNLNSSHLSREAAGRIEDFTEGLRVCCECMVMATDGGLIPEGVEALAVGGAPMGADTVASVRATASARLSELRVIEIMAISKV